MSAAPGRRTPSSTSKSEVVIVETRTGKPHKATHWSTRGLTQLRSWPIDRFKLSTDPRFVDEVKDIVAHCMKPSPTSTFVVPPLGLETRSAL
jgi:hypothetical protein